MEQDLSVDHVNPMKQWSTRSKLIPYQKNLPEDVCENASRTYVFDFRGSFLPPVERLQKQHIVQSIHSRAPYKPLYVYADDQAGGKAFEPEAKPEVKYSTLAIDLPPDHVHPPASNDLSPLALIKNKPKTTAAKRKSKMQSSQPVGPIFLPEWSLLKCDKPSSCNAKAKVNLGISKAIESTENREKPHFAGVPIQTLDEVRFPKSRFVHTRSTTSLGGSRVLKETCYEGIVKSRSTQHLRTDLAINTKISSP